MKSRHGAPPIVLRELPAEGRDFEYSRETGELNEVLRDLVGDHPYRFAFRLTPVGNTFDLRGQITTRLSLECAVCTTPFELDVTRALHEYILIEPALAKRDHGTKANHAHEWEDGGPDYTILDADVFQVGEFAHEAVALTEPTRPLCAPGVPGGCAHRDELPEREWLSYDAEDKPSTAVKSKPFQILGSVKLKN